MQRYMYINIYIVIQKLLFKDDLPADLFFETFTEIYLVSFKI